MTEVGEVISATVYYVCQYHFCITQICKKYAASKILYAFWKCGNVEKLTIKLHFPGKNKIFLEVL